MNHVIKCWPIYFEALCSGEKTFELRKDDRMYKSGDILEIREYDPESDSFSGDYVRREVIYKLQGGKFGLAEGYCILGLKVDHE